MPLSNIAPSFASPSHAIWDEIDPLLTPREFRRPFLMDPAFLSLLHRARLSAGVPFRIASSHRSEAENLAAGGAPLSAHLEEPCTAVDLTILNNAERYSVLRAVFEAGFRRIGVARYSVNARGGGLIHLDASRTLPSFLAW